LTTKQKKIHFPQSKNCSKFGFEQKVLTSIDFTRKLKFASEVGRISSCLAVENSEMSTTTRERQQENKDGSVGRPKDRDGTGTSLAVQTELYTS